MAKKKNINSIVLTILAFFTSLIILIPLLIVVLGSFKDAPGAQEFNLTLPSVWHLENYKVVIEKGNMGQAFINSMIITVAVTLIVVIAGSLNAFVVSRKKSRFTGFVYYLFLLGMISPIQIVTTYGLLQMMNLTGTFVGVICVEAALQMPWTIFTLSGFIKNVNEFMVPLYFFNSASKWTMPLTVYNFFGQYSSNWNYVFADLILTALPITILYLICQKYVIAGATAGAVKG